jgi:hypothetical protein
MSAIKIIVITLLIVPFLFVTGIITSSVKALNLLSNGDNHIWMTKVAAYGKRLENASKSVVYMEMDIIRKIIADISKTRRSL